MKCACGIGRPCQTDPRCFICRAIAAHKPDWSAERVSDAGRKRWEQALAKGEAARKARGKP